MRLENGEYSSNSNMQAPDPSRQAALDMAFFKSCIGSESDYGRAWEKLPLILLLVR